MGRATGPHTRNSLAGSDYRGSRKRVDSLTPFDPLPADFWLFIGVALLMLGVCAALIYDAISP
jgi:hypothetical protein